MRYLEIKNNCTTDGIGIRVSLYVSGCDIHCKGCHNLESQNRNNGLPYTLETEEYILMLLKEKYIDGLTICGGEPSMYYNRPQLTLLVDRIRKEFPSKSIWIYTGRSWDEVKGFELFKKCDIAVVNPFVLEMRDVSDNNKFKGSTNQKFINCKTGEEIKF